MNIGNDKDIFARAMRGVKRLEFEERATFRRRRPATARMARTARRELLREILDGSNDRPSDALEQLGEGTAYRRPGPCRNEPFANCAAGASASRRKRTCTG